MHTLTELARRGRLDGRRVLMRVDFNVPVRGGKVLSDARIVAALPGVRLVLEHRGTVLLMSHLGRPVEGADPSQNQAFSLQPVAERLSTLLGEEVCLVKDWIDGLAHLPGRVVLLENVRFLAGEKAGDPKLAQRMAALGDIFVMDAFATAHRAHASTTAIAGYMADSCVGPLVERELNSLETALAGEKRPIVAIVGGAKVSTKLPLLQSLARRVDHLLVGGGIANTFLAAAGYNVGASLYEPELLDTASAMASEVDVPLPEDVCVVSAGAPEDESPRCVSVAEIGEGDAVMDIGPATSKSLTAVIGRAGTVIWNGPLGVFEDPRFAAGTRLLAQAIAASNGFSLAGGGETVAAAEQFGVSDRLSYVSTGGGAFLQYLQGAELPALVALERTGKS